MATEREVKEMKLQAKECGQPLEAGKGKEKDSPIGHPEGTQPCCHLDFLPVAPCQTSNLQNCKIINLCFKSLSLW